MRRFLAAAALMVGACAWAHAHEVPQPRVEAPFAGLVQERDVRLVFEFLHGALDAAVRGEEVQPPEALARRAEALAYEVPRRGAAAAHAVLEHVEAQVRRALRDWSGGR